MRRNRWEEKNVMFAWGEGIGGCCVACVLPARDPDFPRPDFVELRKKGVRMAWNLRLGVLLLLFSLVSFSANASDNVDSYSHCESIVRSWAESSHEIGKTEDKLTLKDLLFFLHVPRTGGRSYFHCFLRKLYTKAQQCPISYDKLRFDPSKPNCQVVVSHDDYSLATKLPKERTSVVTIQRNPVERVFSTYEFSIEVAARFLVHPNLTSAKQLSTRIRHNSRGVSTLDIWPWKYLVPWMREDLFERRDARRVGKLKGSNKGIGYDMEDMVLPLHQFINDPMAHELIHNGATFQITGLTNNSHFDGAHKVRRCVRMHPSLGHLVLEVAKSRLDQMLYVGLTEDHEESARLFANMVGAQVLSKSGTLKLDLEPEFSNGTDLHSSATDFLDEGPNEVRNSTYIRQIAKAPATNGSSAAKGNITVGKLMETYESCVSSLTKSQSKRRAMSLKKIAPAVFSKEARRQVSEEVLKQIILLNSLDMELYKHARNIFTQQEDLMQKVRHALVQKPGFLTIQKDWINTWPNLHDYSPWKLFLFASGILVVVIFVSLAVTARKRTSKLKV